MVAIDVFAKLPLNYWFGIVIEYEFSWTVDAVVNEMAPECSLQQMQLSKSL